MDLDNHRLVLSNGDTVFFKHLVAADGALSSTVKSLCKRKPRLAFCAETHIPKNMLSFNGEVRVYFGVVKVGYAWVFPSGDEVCVGLGGMNNENVKYDEVLRQFLSSLGVQPQNCVLKGAFVPYGKLPKRNAGSKDVLFIGDAGGFTDPIYGEGLYFALKSGIDAAKSVISCSENVRKEFSERTKPIAKIIGNGDLVKKLFFRRKVLSLFKNHVKGKNRFVGYYCDNQVSRYNYSYLRLFKLYRDYKKSGKVDK